MKSVLLPLNPLCDLVAGASSCGGHRHDQGAARRARAPACHLHRTHRMHTVVSTEHREHPRHHNDASSLSHQPRYPRWRPDRVPVSMCVLALWLAATMSDTACPSCASTFTTAASATPHTCHPTRPSRHASSRCASHHDPPHPGVSTWFQTIENKALRMSKNVEEFIDF